MLRQRLLRPKTLIRLVLLLVISTVLLRFNLRLQYPSLASEAKERRDLRSQLDYLGRGLREKNFGEDMQMIFPEGYFFSHVLYGLAWCEYSLRYQPDANELALARQEAGFALAALESSKGTQVFPESMEPAHGIFYQGWTNYLRAKLLAISPAGSDSLLLQSYNRHCDDIAAALNALESPWLESYPGQCWPSDPTVAVASLSLSAHVGGKDHSGTVQRWMAKVRQELDPANGMIPHQAECSADGFPQGARGCSNVLMIRFLSEIDPEFARQQFDLLRQHFLMKRMGRWAIREYPKGAAGTGDVDSGPVIFGMGFSATIVGIATANAMGEEALANSLSGSIEAFGFPWPTGGGKHFLWGMLPVSDAFIAWGRATATVLPPPAEPLHQGFGMVWMHLISVVLWLWCIWRFWRRNLRQ